MLKKLRKQFHDHLVRPFTETFAPLPEVGRGAVVGMFVGLMPIMGIQMYVAAAIWVIARYVFRIRFNLAIAVALVWITNPITTIPIYYVYLVTGNWALQFADPSLQPVSYAEFEALFHGLLQRPDLGWGGRIVESVVLVFWGFGWPIVFGSFVFAIPLTVLSYPVTRVWLDRYRRGLAAQAGLTYDEWNRRFVRSQPEPAGVSPLPPGPGG